MAGIEDNTDSASSTTSEMINTADTDKRLRTLTESGKELFENKQRKFLLKMQIVKSDLQLLARNIEPYSNELTSLQELKTEFMSGTVRYDTICKEYLDFLSRTNTAEGMDEVHKLSGEMQDFTQFVETESKRMNTFINELRAIERENSLASRSSRRSHSSRKTHSSSSSSVLARARAKAEAAKVKVHFAEKETLLLKEKALIEEKRSIESAKVERKKADIEADLDLLSRQKEAAAVEAEANALQNECDENMSQVLPDQPPLDSKSKTAAYINHVQKQISSIEIDKENTDAFHIDKENKHSTHIDQENTHVSGTLDPHANSFIPRKNIIADTHVSDNHPYPSDRTLATDFTRFLLKRDLLMSSQQANTGFKDKLPTTKGKLNDVRTRKTDFAETKNERSQSVDPHRISIFPPCTSELKIDEVRTLEVDESAYDKIGKDVFIRRPDDDKPGLSRDDREFIESMDTNLWKDSSGNWSAPLPFRQDRQVLPNNRNLAWKRAKGLDANLRKDLQKREHFFTFMNTILEKGHAEKAPHINDDQEQWYLPIFGVYHPKKPGKLRAVFDSSAQFDGVSLNNVLLSGPDLTNNLIGVLLRFRREQVAIMGDIEQMFYSFKVDEKHRDYLRFFWYTDNDFDKPLTVYRMCVHVFGNSPSPAIHTDLEKLPWKEKMTLAPICLILSLEIFTLMMV
ncbi:Hypothetical predicted protein [Mytilus galloprovincialis]|uniref:Uncharacterized protein n=1 Tax=Mytilus galloprovincialis TaxID=29158 RepID=A0A8B6DFC1_MYTGA|nr:Hypothetical predicted protein [Mytilus galloprovincialis]